MKRFQLFETIQGEGKGVTIGIFLWSPSCVWVRVLWRTPEDFWVFGCVNSCHYAVAQDFSPSVRSAREAAVCNNCYPCVVWDGTESVVSQPVNAEGDCSVSLENLPRVLIHPILPTPGSAEPQSWCQGLHDHNNRVCNQRGGGRRERTWVHVPDPCIKGRHHLNWVHQWQASTVGLVA